MGGLERSAGIGGGRCSRWAVRGRPAAVRAGKGAGTGAGGGLADSGETGSPGRMGPRRRPRFARRRRAVAVRKWARSRTRPRHAHPVW